MGVKMLKMAIFFKLIMEIKQKTYISISELKVIAIAL